MRGTKAPSKFTRLDKLLQIQKDHYIGANGIDYCQEATDSLIMFKQTKKAEELADVLIRQLDHYEPSYIPWCNSYEQEIDEIKFLIAGNPQDTPLLKQELRNLIGY